MFPIVYFDSDQFYLVLDYYSMDVTDAINLSIDLSDLIIRLKINPIIIQ